MPSAMLTPGTLAVSSLNLLLWAAGRRGADVPSLCRAVDFDPRPAAGPDARVPITTIQRLWPLVIEATHDPHLDLHLGRLVDFATAGTLAYVMMHAPTVAAALVQLCRYQGLACEGVRTRLQPAAEWPGGAWLTLELTSADIIYPRYVVNSELSLYIAALAALTGQPVVPQLVRLAYPRPIDTSEHEQAFNTTALEFDALVSDVAFDAATLARPVRHANPALFPLFEQHAAALLAQLPTHQPPALPEQVRGEIVRRLRGEAPTLAAVADHLCLGVRTLQLKLKEAGHTYQQLLDEVRQQLAQRHLREPHLSITDVAFLLGYSEPSVFVRSFKKWTGLTPGGFRRQAAPHPLAQKPGAGGARQTTARWS